MPQGRDPIFSAVKEEANEKMCNPNVGCLFLLLHCVVAEVSQIDLGLRSDLL